MSGVGYHFPEVTGSDPDFCPECDGAHSRFARCETASCACDECETAVPVEFADDSKWCQLCVEAGCNDAVARCHAYAAGLDL